MLKMLVRWGKIVHIVHPQQGKIYTVKQDVMRHPAMDSNARHSHLAPPLMNIVVIFLSFRMPEIKILSGIGATIAVWIGKSARFDCGGVLREDGTPHILPTTRRIIDHH